MKATSVLASWMKEKKRKRKLLDQDGKAEGGKTKLSKEFLC